MKLWIRYCTHQLLHRGVMFAGCCPLRQESGTQGHSQMQGCVLLVPTVGFDHAGLVQVNICAFFF